MREAVVREGFERLRASARAEALAAKCHGAAGDAPRQPANPTAGRDGEPRKSGSDGEIAIPMGLLEEFRLSMRPPTTPSDAGCAPVATKRSERPVVELQLRRHSSACASNAPTEPPVIRPRSARQLIGAEKELARSMTHLFPPNRAPVPSDAFTAEMHSLRAARGFGC